MEGNNPLTNSDLMSPKAVQNLVKKVVWERFAMRNVMDIIAWWNALPKGSNARAQLYKDLSQALTRIEISNEIPFLQDMKFAEWVKQVAEAAPSDPDVNIDTQWLTQTPTHTPDFFARTPRWDELDLGNPTGDVSVLNWTRSLGVAEPLLAESTPSMTIASQKRKRTRTGTNAGGQKADGDDASSVQKTPKRARKKDKRGEDGPSSLTVTSQAHNSNLPVARPLVLSGPTPTTPSNSLVVPAAILPTPAEESIRLPNTIQKPTQTSKTSSQGGSGHNRRVVSDKDRFQHQRRKLYRAQGISEVEAKEKARNDWRAHTEASENEQGKARADADSKPRSEPQVAELGSGQDDTGVNWDECLD